jgi:SAM-dependent methyltransferase
VKNNKPAYEIPPPITAAKQHGVYPELNHDERARMNFLSAAYRVLASTVAPGNKTSYETQVLPKFIKENGREPESRHEVRHAMNDNAFHNMWGATRRNLMEIRQQTGREIVLRQATSLAERAEYYNIDALNLTLDPDMKIPSYVANVDHHCMPGSYYTELFEGDVCPAANYDTGFFVTTGGTIGALCDGAGQAIANWVKTQYPDFNPKKILDIGVAAGHSLLPIAMAYPEAEIIAIDVSAPMLRYAHARAKSLGINNIQFKQISGEDLTEFADGEFDWVQTSIFLHELSTKSLPKILAESYRVLKTGGITLHLEQPQYDDDMPLFEQFMRDWDAYNNNEPFWTAMHAINMEQALCDSGFIPSNLFHAAMRGIIDTKLFNESRLGEEEDYGRSAAWHAYGAWKK